MSDLLAPLLNRIRNARDFDEVATDVLRAMFDLTERVFAAGPHQGRAKVLRGMVHLRPDQG